MSDGFEGTEQRPSVSNDYQRVATFLSAAMKNCPWAVTKVPADGQ